jgi:hypothetical protein
MKTAPEMLSVSANQGGLRPTERATLMNIGNIDNNGNGSTNTDIRTTGNDCKSKSTLPCHDLQSAVKIGFICGLILAVLAVLAYLFVSAYAFAVTVRR